MNSLEQFRDDVANERVWASGLGVGDTQLHISGRTATTEDMQYFIRGLETGSIVMEGPRVRAASRRSPP